MTYIKDLTKYKDEIKNMYIEVFNETIHDAHFIIDDILDLKHAYAVLEDNNVIASVVIPLEKIVTDGKKQWTIANLCAVMTKPEYRGKHYAMNLLKFVADECVEQYDCVVWQSYNWDIYKQFDMIENTTKIEVEYVPGNYPTPKFIVWDKPDVPIIKAINAKSDHFRLGVLDSDQRTQAGIDIHINEGLSYIANSSAYIWYDKDHNIIDMQYVEICHLIWLMHQIKPKGTFLLFNDSEIKEISCLKVTSKTVEITKTYAKSKKYLKNIKLNDYQI